MNAEREFLSPGGIRSISKIHQHGYSVHIEIAPNRVDRHCGGIDQQGKHFRKGK